MDALAFIKEDQDNIKLICYEMPRYICENSYTEDETQNKNEYRQQGIYQILWDSGEMIWFDTERTDVKKIAKNDFINFNIEGIGTFKFNKLRYIHEGSNLPQHIVLKNGEIVDLSVYTHSYGNKKICIGTDTDEVYIKTESFELKIDANYECVRIISGNYILNFKLCKDESVRRSDNSIYSFQKERNHQCETLLNNIKSNMVRLEELQQEINNSWVYEDCIYRFYHGSFKVYNAQEDTIKIVDALKSLMDEKRLNQDFEKIIKDGTGKEFNESANSYWLMETLPITTAFFHVKYMLDMIVKYGKELDHSPNMLPYGWASVLYLYNLR